MVFIQKKIMYKAYLKQKPNQINALSTPIPLLSLFFFFPYFLIFGKTPLSPYFNIKLYIALKKSKNFWVGFGKSFFFYMDKYICLKKKKKKKKR